jgi:hypothetical protein
MAYNNATKQWEYEDDSVAKQVNKLTSQNSPLMQQAKTAGMQTANRRGLLNSSMAVGESQREAYNAAIPIASQEASQIASKNTTQMGLLADQNIAAMNVAAHDRQYAQAGLAAADTAYAQGFASLAANTNLPADVRNKYLSNLQKMRDSAINMVSQMYGVQLTWDTPT